jgi:beta-lactamase regulating signal transducer with metallopeptidase domain
MPSTHIPALELAISVAVRILAAYLLFYALTRLTSRPSVRHALWMAFVILSTLYWVTAAAQIAHPLRAEASSSSEAATAPKNLVHSQLTTFVLPSEWRHEVVDGVTLLGWLYLLGVATAIGLRIFSRRLRLRTVVANAQQVSPELSAVFQQECERLKVSRCQLLQIPNLGSPGTAYVWDPVVILPEGIDSYLDREQLVDVLCHELAHVKRLDFVWNSIADVAACLLFFHPVIWLALRELSRDRELACDLKVVESRDGRASGYALCLTRLARRHVALLTSESPSPLALLDSFLAHRVKALLSGARRPTRPSQVAAGAAAVSVACVFSLAWPSLDLTVLIAETSAPAIAIRSPNARTETTRGNNRRGALALKAATKGDSIKDREEGWVEESVPAPPRNSMSPVDASLDGDGDGLTTSNPAFSRPARIKVVEGNDRSPTSQGQNTPSWQKTATDAAIGAAGRIASGKHEGADADDRVTRPF